MNKLKCVIIEDEIPAAEELKYILTQNKLIDVKGLAFDGNNGLNLIKNINPDAVFLDISMPLKNGIEIAQETKNYNNDIDIIFVTAFEQHALKAFEINALDYILKPFDDKRINITINRLVNSWKNKKINNIEVPKIITKLANKLDEEEKLLKKIPCESYGKIILIKIEDIYFCYTKNEKVYIKTKNCEYLTNYTISKIQQKTNLFRTHRSYLVNIDNVKELYSWFNGTYKLVMNDDTNSEIPISRKNVKQFKKLLGL